MFEKFNQIAEQAATNASRRQFLGRLGRSALAAAAALGGVLALGNIAHGGPVVAACGPSSQIACRGKKPGDRCNLNHHIGVCAYAPNCTCRINNPRGGRESSWDPQSRSPREATAE